MVKHTDTQGEMRAWNNMIQRCKNPKTIGYQWLSERGIQVCPRWLESFDNFYADMGAKPQNSMLKRRDPNGHFDADNCYWFVSKRPRKPSNKGAGRPASCFLTHNGVTKSMAEWARELGVIKATISYRIKAGWPIDKVLTPMPERDGKHSGCKPLHCVTANGKTQSVPKWAKETGLTPDCIYGRLRRGWTGDQIINTPKFAKLVTVVKPRKQSDV